MILCPSYFTETLLTNTSHKNHADSVFWAFPFTLQFTVRNKNNKTLKIYIHIYLQSNCNVAKRKLKVSTGQKTSEGEILIQMECIYMALLYSSDRSKHFTLKGTFTHSHADRGVGGCYTGCQPAHQKNRLIHTPTQTLMDQPSGDIQG